jgi:hypothetical protein
MPQSNDSRHDADVFLSVPIKDFISQVIHRVLQNPQHYGCAITEAVRSALDHVEFLVENIAVVRIISQYVRFPYQLSFYKLIHIN